MTSSELGLSNNEVQQNTNFLLQTARAYFVLQTKVLGFHWNITGPHFTERHEFFQESYQELSEALDDVAERMRVLNAPAPQGVRELSTGAVIDDTQGMLMANQMLDVSKDDYQKLIQTLRVMLDALRNAADEGTKDLLIEHLRQFEKRLWMIRSLIQH